MTPGRFDPTVVRRHLLALDDAVQTLRRHQGRSLAELRANREELCYLEVDVEIVHRLLNERLEDFTEFARHIKGPLG